MRRVVKQQQRVKTGPAFSVPRPDKVSVGGSTTHPGDPSHADTLMGAIQIETDKIDVGLEAAGCWVDLDALEGGPRNTPVGAPPPPPPTEVIDLWLTPRIASAELRALADRELSVEELYATVPEENREPAHRAPSPAESFDDFVRQLSGPLPKTEAKAAPVDTTLSRPGVFSMLHDLASARVAQEEVASDIRWVQPKSHGDWKLTSLSDADDAAEDYIDLWNDQRPLRRALGA